MISIMCVCMSASGRYLAMNPTQQQQPAPQPPPQVSTVSSRLPPGVENVVVTYSLYGRPRVMLTLDPGARRKLMVFSVILLVFGPLILVFNSVCLAMGHSYLAYGYAAGVLVSIRINCTKLRFLYLNSSLHALHDVMCIDRLLTDSRLCVLHEDKTENK